MANQVAFFMAATLLLVAVNAAPGSQGTKGVDSSNHHHHNEGHHVENYHHEESRVAQPTYSVIDEEESSPEFEQIKDLETRLAALEAMCAKLEQQLQKIKDEHVKIEAGQEKRCGPTEFLHTLIHENQGNAGSNLIATGLAVKIQQLAATERSFEFMRDAFELTQKYEQREAAAPAPVAV